MKCHYCQNIILENPFIYKKKYLFCNEDCLIEMKKNLKKGSCIAKGVRKCYLCGAICVGKRCKECFSKGGRGAVKKRRKERKDG